MLKRFVDFASPREVHRVLALAFVTTLTLQCPTAWGDTMTGKVVGITDGDTVTVLVDRHEFKVRIAGIDAPEKRQPFGPRSKQGMSDCAFNRDVDVEWDKTDRYGRTIGKVLADGVDCGLRQIELGLAWHYKAYAKDQSPKDRQTYALAESHARSA